MRTNQLGTGLDLGAQLPIGNQCVAYDEKRPCGRSVLGAHGSVVIRLIVVIINTEIFSAILRVVCCGARRGRSGNGTLLATSCDCIVNSFVVQCYRLLWGVIRFSWIVLRQFQISFYIRIQHYAVVVFHILCRPFLYSLQQFEVACRVAVVCFYQYHSFSISVLIASKWSFGVPSVPISAAQ